MINSSFKDLESSDRAANFLSYLDESEKDNTEIKAKVESNSKIMELQTEISEARHLITSLKEIIWRQKDSLKKKDEDYKEILRQEISRCQQEYEAKTEENIQYIIYRFIEKLVADKEARLKQIADLNKKLKETEAKYTKILEDMKEKSVKELKKNKDAWMASEKLRRENWIKEKTREIKEITAKGLEPEITRIMMENKNAMDKLKEEHSRELKEARNSVEEEVTRRLVRDN